jgi:hypothetical protein
MIQDPTELAYYYPEPMWQASDVQANWIKNLILYFDGIALLVPEYIRDKPFRIDPAIAEGLQEHGLLRILEPESFIDKPATNALATVLTDLLNSGALDSLSEDRTSFAELSYSRLGYYADAGLAQGIYDELMKRGLARRSEDGVSIPVHPMVRSLVLVLLAQLLRATGRAQGLDLSPVTDNRGVQSSLTEVLGLPATPSAGHVVTMDLQQVGIDLSSIPLDEVVAFRAQHGESYRQYARSLRRFVRDLGKMTPQERSDEIQDRQEEIADSAAALRATARGAWRKPASFLLMIGGAAWNLTQGDAWGDLLSIGGAVLGAGAPPTPEVAEAYSYLFEARQQFGGLATGP